ncbi:2,3-diaminopropionate biosynthesis protein SbnB [Streptomyces sp. WM6378]|uniref:2,3-diaminopropionate biosynthesis protein SbnB n=1 Tax=Streptomyces sp. WM6378 TaxID=1415557 RepID=UPI0006AF68EA|nr:2,3-diaminopropionate biosynthesis protein SbnB [Streptomyces sp. WM6378]KOU36275.1 ornithine cyclodeaminase [Streptomyces sp. WM6378]
MPASGNEVPSFSVISGAQVHQVLDGQEKQIVELVDYAYRVHGIGDTVNPPSYFLRFEDRPSSRIIALPASVGGEIGVDGIKWISSFPENITQGLPRASAVLILNDQKTGYPFACMESSIVSAVRTAASAALAADWLTRERGRPVRVGFIGTGLIARYIHTYLTGSGWTFDEVGVHDLSTEYAAGFGSYLEQSGSPARITVHDDAESLIRSSDLVVFATVAGAPHVTNPGWFSHNPVVLNVSLRDLGPEVIKASSNVVDDVEHVLKADTSVHLVEQEVGNRYFLNGTLHNVMTGMVKIPTNRPVVFSPFGLGVLDLTVAKYVYDELVRAGELGVVDGFFHELSRHGKK